MTINAPRELFSTDAPVFSKYPNLQLDPWRLVFLHVLLFAVFAGPALFLRYTEPENPTPSQKQQYEIQMGAFQLQGSIYIALLIVFDLFAFLSRQKLIVEVLKDEQVVKITSKNRFFESCASTASSFTKSSSVSEQGTLFSSTYVVPFDQISHLQADTVDDDELTSADIADDDHDENKNDNDDDQIPVVKKKNTPNPNPSFWQRKYPTPIKLITKNRALLLDGLNNKNDNANNTNEEGKCSFFQKICGYCFSSSSGAQSKKQEEVDDSFIVLEFAEVAETTLRLRQWEHFLKNKSNITHLKKANLPSKDIEEKYSSDGTVATLSQIVWSTNPKLSRRLSIVLSLILILGVAAFQYYISNIDLDVAGNLAKFENVLKIYLTFVAVILALLMLAVFCYARRIELELDEKTRTAKYTCKVIFPLVSSLSCLTKTVEMDFRNIVGLKVEVVDEDPCNKTKIKFINLEYNVTGSTKNQEVVLRMGGIKVRDMERSEQIKRGIEKLFERFGIDVQNKDEVEMC